MAWRVESFPSNPVRRSTELSVTPNRSAVTSPAVKSWSLQRGHRDQRSATDAEWDRSRWRGLRRRQNARSRRPSGCAGSPRTASSYRISHARSATVHPMPQIRAGICGTSAKRRKARNLRGQSGREQQAGKADRFRPASPSCHRTGRSA